MQLQLIRRLPALLAVIALAGCDTGSTTESDSTDSRTTADTGSETTIADSQETSLPCVISAVWRCDECVGTTDGDLIIRPEGGSENLVRADNVEAGTVVTFDGIEEGHYSVWAYGTYSAEAYYICEEAKVDVTGCSAPIQVELAVGNCAHDRGGTVE